MRKSFIKRIIAASVLTTMLTASLGCAKKPVVDPINDNYRVFYEIFVGSFSDSDGDGTGDLKGIINRLDYLNDGDINSGESLGIQGIWLSPLFESPSYHKYDAKDYYKIDEKFGTEADLKELLDECHKRNVKVIIDLVLNHSSDENEWFKKFASAHQNKDTSNTFYDFYTYVTDGTMLPGHAYYQIPGCPGEYYEGNFSSDMPEMNYDSENVYKCMFEVAQHYLGLGVDGFRFDAVKYIYYNDADASVKFWKRLMADIKEIKPDAYCVGECWSGQGEILKYVEAMNCFDFQISQADGYVAMAVKGGDMSTYTNYIDTYQKQVQKANPDAMPVSFISNHDMDRMAGYMMLAKNWTQMAANLYILSPGSPFIYYGEEIGMKGTRGGANTDANRRLAMNWGDEDTVDDPLGATYDRNKQTNGTVKEQLEKENSLVKYYAQLISIRNKYPAIARGDYKSLKYDNAYFGGSLITYNDEKIGLFHNTKDEELVIDLTSTKSAEISFAKLVDSIGQGTASLEGNTLTIGPQTSVILK
ncbi:MAG: alpha-amylase family glycosyl hydrolase [Lachnospiraceae bacterium]|nr:alpha-amylase family glycosyl hydrolase [Lachnospiraceae bacterium]